MKSGIRIWQLANECGVWPQTVMRVLRELGAAERAPNVQSLLDLGLADTVRERILLEQPMSTPTIRPPDAEDVKLVGRLIDDGYLEPALVMAWHVVERAWMLREPAFSELVHFKREARTVARWANSIKHEGEYCGPEDAMRALRLAQDVITLL